MEINTVKYFSKKNAGFTLIELIVTVTVMGIISAIAVPSMIGMLKRMEAQSVAASLQSFLVSGRQNALIYQSTTTLCVANDNNQCVPSGGNILLSFIDKNANDSFDVASDILLERTKVNPKYGYLVTVVSTNRNFTNFRSDSGRPIGFIGHVKYCSNDGDNAYKFKVIFNKMGLIRTRNNNEDPTECA